MVPIQDWQKVTYGWAGLPLARQFASFTIIESLRPSHDDQFQRFPLHVAIIGGSPPFSWHLECRVSTKCSLAH